MSDGPSRLLFIGQLVSVLETFGESFVEPFVVGFLKAHLIRAFPGRAAFPSGSAPCNAGSAPRPRARTPAGTAAGRLPAAFPQFSAGPRGSCPPADGASSAGGFAFSHRFDTSAFNRFTFTESASQGAAGSPWAGPRQETPVTARKSARCIDVSARTCSLIAAGATPTCSDTSATLSKMRASAAWLRAMEERISSFASHSFCSRLTDHRHPRSARRMRNRDRRRRCLSAARL